MESSTSETPIQEGRNPSSAGSFDHHEDFIVQTFRCLGLEDDNRVDRRFPAAAESSVSTQLLCGNPVSDYNNIWDYRLYSHGGDSSSRPRNHDSFHGANDMPNRRHGHHEFNEAGNINPYLGIPSNVATNNGQSMGFWLNNPLTDLRRVQQTLRGEQCEQKEMLVYALQSSVVAMMTDQRMCSIFQALLEACEEGMHFDLLVATIVLDQESFLNAAFCKQGVYTITKLIRKLKRSSHASTVTKILSTRFMDLMTDFTARKVVQVCFVLFRHETNEILYEITISHCHYLARHKVGCRSLNHCISTISGEQRSRLLDKISDIADVLCDDHYGNYVLQVVMGVNHGNVNAKIFDSLRGKFVQLAQRQIGSHIVEKCMEISVTCMASVVKEILKSPRTPQVLADHTFGNYVVQMALRMTKENELTDLYNALVNALRPRFKTLVKTPFGRSVMNVIHELALLDQSVQCPGERPPTLFYDTCENAIQKEHDECNQ